MLPGQRPYRELHWLSRMPGAGITAVAEPVALFVSPLATNKGIDRVLEAHRLVRRQLPEARLEVLGRGPLEGQVRREAERPGSGVTFLGAGDRGRVASALRRAAVFVTAPRPTPVWNEQFGLAYIEAMASGLPVVTTVCGSNHEAVREPNLRVPDDAEALAAAPASERPTAARCWSATSSTASASASARSCAASASASQSPELWPQPLPHQLGPALAEVDAVVAHLHAIHAVHVAPARAQEAPEVEQHHPVPVGGDEAAEDLVQPFAPGGIVARGGQRLVQAGVWLVVAGHVQHGDAPARQRHQVVGELQLAVQVLPVPRGGGLQHATVDLVVEHLPAPEHHQGDVGMEGGGLVAPARRPGGALGVDRLHAAGQDDGSAHQTAAELRVAAKGQPANSPPGVVEAEGEADRVADQVDPEGIARVRPAGRLAG